MIQLRVFAAFTGLLFLSAGAWAGTPEAAGVREAATKVCNTKLDHDDFPYSTMEECVDDQSAKLVRAQKNVAGAPRSTAGK